VFWGAFAGREPARNREHIAQVFRWIVEKRIRPTVDAVLPFDRAAEALERLVRREVKGKLVLVP